MLYARGVAVFEHSAGAVILAEENGELFVALLHSDKDKWVLPKGNMQEGEKAEETARREAGEELGFRGQLAFIAPLGSHQYFYRVKGEKEVRLKRVNLFLFKARSRGFLSPQKEEGFLEALWLPLSEAREKLTFNDDKKALDRAEELVS